MDNNACEQLAARFSALEQGGLCDVKFYVRNVEEAAKDQVCREVSRLYEAVERGESRPLKFEDSHQAQ